MKIALFAAIASVVMLDGCVSEKTVLTNPQGQQTRCDAWGFGLGAPIAMASHHSCMENARAAGYSEFPHAAAAP
jgi:hypothetical protein